MSKLEAIKQKNYYEILNVGRDAPIDQIREAYKEIAKLYHPDSNFYAEIIQVPLTPEENEIFKLITLAYTTLTNPEKRAQYDETIPKGLRSWEEEDTPWEHPKPRGQNPGGVTDSTLRDPGSIDLNRFQGVRRQHAAQPPSQPTPPPNPQNILFLSIALGLAFGLCVGICLLLFVKVF